MTKESIKVITFLVDKGAYISLRAGLGTQFPVLAFALYAANVDLAKHLVDIYPVIIPEEGSSESNLLQELSHKLTV